MTDRPSIADILSTKRDGGTLDRDALWTFVDGVVHGSVSRPQAAAFLAFAFVQGLDGSETLHLTQAMTELGEQLSWPTEGGPLIDKHSTGGVGDKVSLVLAPLWAELGFRVPMISGRGLGHTGGTLDKLESIPGFGVDLSVDALQRCLADVGCFISGQTGALAPADRVLYGLRNETQTVASVPLITASILSKKLAEGIGALVLDVKYGRGAFMTTLARAQQLADTLVAVGQGAGVATRAVLSPMNEPLGRAVGNALEVQEAVACLSGGGPADLRALVLQLADHPDAAAVLDSGRAHDRFCRMVVAQGGNPDAPLAGLAQTRTVVVKAPASGVVLTCDALDVGMAAFELGAGREKAADSVHHGVGIMVHAKTGEEVRAGAPLFTVHHVDRGLDGALGRLAGAVTIGEGAPGHG